MIPKLFKHKRMKPKAGAPPAVQERAHMDWVASLPCLVCKDYGVTLHHVTGYARKAGRITRSHRLVVPLKPEYHLIQHGPKMSVEALGHQGFFREWGLDLLAEAERLEQMSIDAGRLT